MALKLANSQAILRETSRKWDVAGALFYSIISLKIGLYSSVDEVGVLPERQPMVLVKPLSISGGVSGGCSASAVCGVCGVWRARIKATEARV